LKVRQSLFVSPLGDKKSHLKHVLRAWKVQISDIFLKFFQGIMQ